MMLKKLQSFDRKISRTSELHHQKKFRISELPDDVVVSIINFLTIKEAIATSILSRRWRNLWKYTSRSWGFIQSELRLNYQNSTNMITEVDYIMLVNRALESHRGSLLEDLVFCLDDTNYLEFCLDDTYYSVSPRCAAAAENWIHIASRKSVRRLDLIIPDLDLNKFVQPLPIFLQLTRLTLKGVIASGETLHFLLSRCQLLEHLYLIKVLSLKKLKIGGDSSLKLKHLEIVKCFYLENLEISAPNLVSFVCNEVPTTLFMDVSLLRILSIGKYDDFCNLQITEPLIHYVSQIESLTLKLIGFKGSYPLNQSNLDFRNLKHLELRIDHAGGGFLPYTCLLKACPILSSLKFVLKKSQKNIKEKSRREVVKFCKNEYLRHNATITRHQYLRLVTVCGFLGHIPHIELGLHLIMMAISLEKMVINCYRSTYLVPPDHGRQSAEVLASMVTSTTEFVVL